MHKQITLKELSKILGVSISTISKALNNSYEISDSTKERIQKVAKEYNYQPNIIAKNLKSGKTNTIGVIIPSVQNYFLARVLYGIEDTLANTPYNSMICITKESLEREKNGVLTLSNGLVDGFIIATSEETQKEQDYDHYQFALNKNKPVVVFDRIVPNLDCDKIITNDYDAVYTTTKELVKYGLKKVMSVATIQTLSVGIRRLKGYKDAVEKPYIIRSTPEEVEEKIISVIKTDKPDAIMAIDEAASLASIRACKKLGLKIPEEISIVGYTGTVMAENLMPRLTTINQHGYTVGKTAAEMLMQKLQKKSKELVSDTVNSTLQKRDSTNF